MRMNEKELEERLDRVEQRLSVLCKVLEHLTEHLAEEQGINIEGLKEAIENE